MVELDERGQVHTLVLVRAACVPVAVRLPRSRDTTPHGSLPHVVPSGVCVRATRISQAVRGELVPADYNLKLYRGDARYPSIRQTSRGRGARTMLSLLVILNTDRALDGPPPNSHNYE